MTEVDARIARLEHLLAAPGEAELDEEVTRHTLALLRQLRVETAPTGSPAPA